MGMVIFTQVHNIHFDSEKRFTILSPLFPILCYLDLMELPVTNLDEPAVCYEKLMTSLLRV